jgi:hypothetical protein
MVQQVQSFLRDLERLGLAEPSAVPDARAKTEIIRPTASATFELLRSLAEHVGYRIA